MHAAIASMSLSNKFGITFAEALLPPSVPLPPAPLLTFLVADDNIHDHGDLDWSLNMTYMMM